MAKGPKVIVYSETFHRSSSSGFPQNGFNRIEAKSTGLTRVAELLPQLLYACR